MKRLNRLLLVMIVNIFIIASTIHAQEGYHNYKSLKNELEKLNNSYSNLVELQSIGKTMENRDVWMLQVSNEKKGNPDEKSALFLTANLEADHLIGSEAVLATIWYMLENYEQDEKIRQLIDQHTCYFVPRVNPDGAERFFADVKFAKHTNLNPTDSDHDGKIDEDPPEDINNDGFITKMRVRDPEGEFFPDSADKRILKKADISKGQKGVFKIYMEGMNNDNDGEYNEDPKGGVNINKNFPHQYPYYSPDAGRYMTSEPETRALIDFLIDHRNVCMILSYTLHDNLIQSPKPKRTRPQQEANQEDRSWFRRARKPETAINKKDIPYFQKAGEIYRKMMDIKPDRKNASAGKTQGTFHEWGYFQYGVLSMTTPIWHLPKMETKKDTAKAKRPAKQQIKKKEKVSDDVKWLQWIDTQRNGNGFVDWEPFQHETLGKVDIGGFEPFIKTTPPADLLSDYLEKHAKYFVSLGELFPKLELVDFNVSKKSSQVYHIKVIIENNGFLPTAFAQGVRARAVKPTLLRLQGEDIEILAGKRIEFLDTLAGSGTAKKFDWIVKAEAGTTLELEINSEKAGDIVQSITLR